MKELRKYLEKTNVISLYPRFNHVLKFLYDILVVAALEEADTIVATKSDVFWEKDGKILGDFPSSAEAPVPTFGYDQALVQVLQYDEFLRNHLIVLDQAEEKITCKLIYD